MGRDASVLRDGFIFPEGLRWRSGRLWVSDQLAGTVHAVTEDGKAELILKVPGGASGLGWLPDGSLLVVSMADRRLLRLGPDGATTEHANLAHLPGFRLNDMVVDGTGRAYVGDFGFDVQAFAAEHGSAAVTGPLAPTTILARVDPDGAVRVAADGLRFPNGCAITPDGRTLIVAETLGMRLTAFDIDGAGDLSERRVWAAGADYSPDGICLDAEGAVWVANARAAECLRVTEGGDVLDRVCTSGTAYSCALGGADGRTLWVATAPPAAATRDQGGAGRIEFARVDVPAP